MEVPQVVTSLVSMVMPTSRHVTGLCEIYHSAVVTSNYIDAGVEIDWLANVWVNKRCIGQSRVAVDELTNMAANKEQV
eukprot:227703-Ditylum_brightwellii.AAC.1